jgi:hypothetical protein
MLRPEYDINVSLLQEYAPVSRRLKLFLRGSIRIGTIWVYQEVVASIHLFSNEMNPGWKERMALNFSWLRMAGKNTV